MWAFRKCDKNCNAEEKYKKMWYFLVEKCVWETESDSPQ